MIETIMGALVVLAALVAWRLSRRYAQRMQGEWEANYSVLVAHGICDPLEREGVAPTAPWGDFMDLAALLREATEPREDLIHAVDRPQWWNHLVERLGTDEAGFIRFCGTTLVPTQRRFACGFVTRDSFEGLQILRSFELLCGSLEQLRAAARDGLQDQLALADSGEVLSDEVLTFFASTR